jgi:hypothetical protein
MTLEEVGTVQGFVLSFSDPAILAVLDDYEQHAPEYFQIHAPDLSLEAHQYQRLQIETFDLDQRPLTLAWSYVMTSQQIQSLRGHLVSSGEWIRNWGGLESVSF